MRRPANKPSESARQRRRRMRREEDLAIERWIARVLEREIQEATAPVVMPAVLTLAPPTKRRKPRRGGKRPKTTSKDLDLMVKLAWEKGWRIERGGTEHVKVFRPDGKIISVPSSPSRQRTIGRIRSEMRRGGLEL